MRPEGGAHVERYGRHNFLRELTVRENVDEAGLARGLQSERQKGWVWILSELVGWGQAPRGRESKKTNPTMETSSSLEKKSALNHSAIHDRKPDDEVSLMLGCDWGEARSDVVLRARAYAAQLRIWRRQPKQPELDPKPQLSPQHASIKAPRAKAPQEGRLCPGQSLAPAGSGGVLGFLVAIKAEATSDSLLCPDEQYKQDASLREVKVMRRYHLQDREDYNKCVLCSDQIFAALLRPRLTLHLCPRLSSPSSPSSRYNKLAGNIRQLAHRLSGLPAADPFRSQKESDLLSKLYDMGLLNLENKLSDCENKVTVSGFCRRRLAVVCCRLRMAETVGSVSSLSFARFISWCGRELTQRRTSCTGGQVHRAGPHPSWT